MNCVNNGLKSLECGCFTMNGFEFSPAVSIDDIKTYFDGQYSLHKHNRWDTTDKREELYFVNEISFSDSQFYVCKIIYLYNKILELLVFPKETSYNYANDDFGQSLSTDGFKLSVALLKTNISTTPTFDSAEQWKPGGSAYLEYSFPWGRIFTDTDVDYNMGGPYYDGGYIHIKFDASQTESR